MGRTLLSPQRLVETKQTNIGRIIIFCEGKTEKYYFEYFAEIIKKNKYTDIEVVLETAKPPPMPIPTLREKNACPKAATTVSPLKRAGSTFSMKLSPSLAPSRVNA